jgi:hypothetical protein
LGAVLGARQLGSGGEGATQQHDDGQPDPQPTMTCALESHTDPEHGRAELAGRSE